MIKIKKVRVTANMPKVEGAADITEVIGKEFDVVEEVIIDLKTMEKEVVIVLDGVDVYLYPGEYEITEEEGDEVV